MEQKRYAAVYTRVSTDEQAKHGLSLNVQKKACIEKAEEEGYEVIEVITDEGISGFKENRPGILKLRKLIEDRSITAIAALSSDRLFRNGGAHLEFMGLIYVNQIQVLYVQQASPDGSASSKLSDSVISMINEYQRNQISDKVKVTLYAKGNAGYFPAVPPPGYMSVENSDKSLGKLAQRIIVPDPITAPLISEIFSLYATGLYSVYDLADQMSRRGLKSRYGYPLSPSRLYDLLKNRIYIGEVHWGIVHNPNGKHQPLTDVETFNRVQAVLESNNHKACRRRKHRWLLAGLVRCAIHGRRYVAEWHKGKTQAYYHCPNRMGCGKYIKQIELENAIAEKFRDLQFSEEFTTLVIEKAKRTFLEKRNKYDGRKQGIVNRRTSLEAKRKAAEDKLFEGALTNERFIEIRKEIETEIEGVNKELLHIEDSRELDVDIAQEILSFTRNIHKAYKNAKSFDLKRQYLGFFWESFEVHDGVILNSRPTPLFSELLIAEQAYYKNAKTEKALDKAFSEEGILSTELLRG